MALALASTTLPSVRLEVRAGGGRPTVYEVGDGGFLMGGVPGCDLRLPGGNVAPVVCLISRHARGASLRRLAPVQPIAVNGRNVGSTYLNTGDRITIGAVEVVVSLAEGVSVSDEPSHEIEARQAELQAQSEQLEKERSLLHRRRDEMEALGRRQTEAAEASSQNLQDQERVLIALRGDIEKREQDLERHRQQWLSRVEEAEKQHTETRGVRRQMSQIREQLYERYRNRRDRLNEKHKTLRRAAKHLQERKRQIDEETAQMEAARQEQALGREENEARAAQVERERTLLEDQHRQIVERQQELQNQLAERVKKCEEREAKVMDERAALEKSQRQHQADLVRLDRFQAQHDQRQKQLETRALEVDKRYEGLQRDLRELEEQGVQMDEWHNRLAGETEKLAQQKLEHVVTAAQVEQRAAALEGQQAMLATLRTRMERMREELRIQEEALSEQRAVQEASEIDLTTRQKEMRDLREALDNDRELHKEERRRFEEGRVTLDAAVAQLRQAQEALESREIELNQRQEEQDATAGEQAEQIGLLTARASQLEELHARLTADRRTLRDREESLAKSEQTLTSLQEQLRRRSEELSERQQAQTVEEQRLRDEAARLEEQAKVVEQERQIKATDLENLRKELSDRAAEMDALSQELLRREEAAKAQGEQLRESEFSLTGQRQTLAAERNAWDVDRQAANEAAERTKRDFEAARADALELIRTLSELEGRAAGGIDRLSRAREQLREHLAEIHGYARQSREDLEAARQHIQAESERVLQQDLTLRVARDEHRLAVASFRQQLIEWQGRVGEMKQTLLQGSTQLERRQAEVQEQAQQIASTSARLAQQAEQLQEKERQVANRRSEMDRHLNDMREWYRRKLRELSGVDAAGRDAALAEADEVVASSPAEDRGILSLSTDAAPGDRKLGDLLRSLELVDADALNALLLEARRQRRSLRQLLLAGNYLTLYQMALIEAGNLDGLVLGPVRVIDRLQAGPREAVFRVFDPRRNGEALLRWLAEAEMHDAVHPDEFRQRFAAAAAVRHVHIAATYEVLELAGRPAVLQEWLTGVAGSDWPALASVPGVWFRLLSQAALALRTVHEAGLVHGALEASSLVCTPEGVVKLCGLGQPRWLAASTALDGVESDAAADLRALGRLAAVWAGATPRKGKSKALPDGLQTILHRLTGEQGTAYGRAAELLEDLDHVSSEAPANTTAWERFVREVREQAGDAGWRRSA